MNIRQAFLAGADYIESNPREFNFMSCAIPKSNHCGTPGCALGWVATFLGIEYSGPGKIERFSCEVLNLPSQSAFYARMNDLRKEFKLDDWHWSADACAQTMRLYADKYHPAAPVRIPDWNAMAAQRTVLPDAVSEDSIRA